MPWKLDNFYRYDSTLMPSALGQFPTALVQNPFSIILGVLLIAFLVYVAWKQPFGKPFSLFAVLWIVVLMLPVINIIPIAIERADRYMYFPSIVIFAAVAILIHRLWQRLSTPGARYAIIGVFAALVVLLTGVTYTRSLVWQNEGALWRDHLDAYPTSQTGWLNLGVYYWNKQDYDNALPVFQQLVSLSPNDFKGNRFLGHIALQQNRPKDAVAFYRKALATQPNDGGTYALLGNAYFKLNDNANAVAAYQRALKLDSTLTSVNANLGSAALRIGNYDVAEQALRKAVERNPRDANSVTDLCTTLSQTQRLDEAISYCQTAVKLQPNNGFYLGRLASLYLDTNQPDKALPVAQQAATVAPNASLSYRVLGEAYADLGQKDRAIAALQKALQIDSGNTRARQLLAGLTGS
jgi:tetratricopeptide (TPR) repeat protein